jgi:hypothetical protein
MKKIEYTICPTCGAKHREWPHTLNRGLVIALFRLADFGGRGNLQEIGLTKNQYTNFYKLKHWGLAVSCRKGGEWEITAKGYKFCLNELAIPRVAWSCRNKSIPPPDGVDEAELVTIDDHLPTEYQKSADYVRLCRSRVIGKGKG